MSDISSQLIKDSYNYVLQSDLSTGNIYRVGGGIPVNPSFLSGLTINSSFKYSNGSEQPGYALITDGFGNATWGPVSGSSSGDYLPLSGGTVTGPTIFTGGLTANTISATTYFNLPSGLTCNDLSGCTIIQNIEQDIIDIQDNYVPYTGATRDLDLGYNTFINNNGLLVSWENGGAAFGWEYIGDAKQMYFIDTDTTNTYQYSGQSIDFICNLEEGWGTTNWGYDFNDGTYFGSTINNTIGAAGFNTQMGDNNVSQVKTFAGEVAITNLTDGSGPLMESSLKLWKDYTQLLITNNDISESNTIEMYTDRTYTKKYITTDEGYVGDYANLNTLTSTTISATTYLNLPVSGVTGGTGISAGTTNGLVTIVNTAPDQIVTLSGGTGISTGGTYPDFVLTNTSPDQTVTITGGTNIGINGTYPNFGINFTGSTGASGDFLPLSGGTVTGATIFTGGLTANTISATTYQNLPQDIFVTGGTYTSGNAIFTNNSGGTFTVTGFSVGGGGGQIFYLNLSQSQGSNRLLSTTGSTASEQSTGVTINNGVTGTIASFQSQPLNTTLLPGGIWSFYLHSYKQNNNASFNIFVEVYKRTSGGTQTLLFTTDPAPVTTNSPNPSMQLSDGYFSGTPLSVSDSIVAVVRATNTSNQSHIITLVSEGSQHYSYAVSTIPTQQGLTCDTLSGCSIIQTIQTDVSNKLDKSGGTITGDLIINSGLTANTISATTYQNLPVTSFSGLSGINLSATTNGEVLTYSSIDNTWKNEKVYNDLQLRRNGITIYDDMIATTATDNFQKLTFNGGGWSVSAFSNENNPGVIAITSSAATSSGGSIIPSNTATPRNYAVGVGMQYDLIMRTSALSANVIMRFGIVAGTTNATQPANGIYLRLNNNDLVGQTASGSTRSQTAAYTGITATTWYHFRVKMVSASLSVYELYDMDGTLLWTDSLTTNLPNIGEGVQPTFIAYNQIAEARQMCQVDYMSFTYPPMNRGALI